MEKKKFTEVFNGASPLGKKIFIKDNIQIYHEKYSAIDLLEKMLELDADKRITAEQVLAHAYLAQLKILKIWLSNFYSCIFSLLSLKQYADPTDEPTSQPYDQTFEDFDVSVEEWKGSVKISLFFSFDHHLVFSFHVERD